MEIPVKTLKNGFSIPVYGLGTWQMGGRRSVDHDNDDQADIQGIKDAIDAGVRHIDTAELYAAGHSEELLGEAIKGYDRSDLLIASKANGSSLTYDNILKACEASLERAGLDYFDLYMAHHWSEAASVEEVMRGLNKLVDDGLIKNIGVSNFNTAGLKAAMAATNHPIVANQVHYNLQSRQPERDGLLEFCQKSDVMLVAWRPVEKGVFIDNTPKYLEELAEKYGKSPAQIAINWLISQDNVVTLSKTRSKAHLQDNLGAIDWSMSDEDIEEVRSNYPDQQDISDTVPLEGH